MNIFTWQTLIIIIKYTFSVFITLIQIDLIWYLSSILQDLKIIIFEEKYRSRLRLGINYLQSDWCSICNFLTCSIYKIVFIDCNLIEAYKKSLTSFYIKCMYLIDSSSSLEVLLIKIRRKDHGESNLLAQYTFASCEITVGNCTGLNSFIRAFWSTLYSFFGKNVSILFC